MVRSPGYFVWIVLLILVPGVVAQILTVQTTLGSVDGSVEMVTIYDSNDTAVNVSYVQYLGIPYAEPPIGNFRFKKPVPKGAWSETHNGTYYRSYCYQGLPPGPIAMKNAQESEDCLSLDIYTPMGSPSDGDSYAVMIFLYGPFGGSSGFIPDALCAYSDIIVVVINFRTTFLGFYSSGDTAAKGNYGLWDQQLAIQWVSDNIAAFKGDPSRVTLMGYSAGAQYALLQAMYPGNKGLIRNVIANSGILVPTYRTSPYSNTGVAPTVEALDCKRDTSEATVTCLRSKSLDDLNTVFYNLPVTFTPVIDGEFVKADPQTVLTSTDPDTETIRDAFSSVNLLTGIDNKEGAMHVVRMWASLLNQQAESFQVNATSFRNVVVTTALDLAFAPNLSTAIADTVAFQYSDLKDPDNFLKIRDSTVQLSTDIDATVPAIKTANLHSMFNTTSRTYFFQFSVNLTMASIFTPSWLDGANHGEEIYFLFGFSRRNLDAWTQTTGFVPTETERNVSRQMMTLWSNFIKNGYPVGNSSVDGLVAWPEYTEVTSSYVDISSEGLFSRNYFREPFVTFWMKIVPALIELGTERPTHDNITTFPTEKPFSDRFNIDSVTSDNIIIALVTISGSLLIAVLLICSLAVIRGTYEKYTVKNV